MIRKVRHAIRYVIAFCSMWLYIFKTMLGASALTVALLNSLVFQKPIGMWYFGFVLAITVLSSFVMTIEVIGEERWGPFMNRRKSTR